MGKILQLYRETLEIFVKTRALEVFRSLGVNDVGKSQLQQQEDVIYTEKKKQSEANGCFG